ncbi:tripartite motif-containing protein 59-like [Crassostrea virginica]
METQQAVAVKVKDITVCSICIEKFKTPRYLPCKHSFCHDCLCSYIVSQCKSTEPRLGFHCPLCRQYTVSDGETEKPEKWAEYFPVNSVLEKMVYQSGNKYCELCLKENEKEPASNYCLTCKEYMCALCTKFHMKFLAMKDHKTVSLSETESVQILSTLEVENPCPVHCNEETILR